MGVWIETVVSVYRGGDFCVTPCVGVWIETLIIRHLQTNLTVTPCVGVWIETTMTLVLNSLRMSHPAWVCGLKHKHDRQWNIHHKVTPCVGVWIETVVI